jgi:hypothetical protein
VLPYDLGLDLLNSFSLCFTHYLCADPGHRTTFEYSMGHRLVPTGCGQNQSVVSDTEGSPSSNRRERRLKSKLK